MDQDCDGETDEAAGDASVWYPDADSDAFGAAAAAGVRACAPPPDHVENAADCDDADSEVNPAGAEVPYDGVDQDCEGGDEEDVDGDGFPAIEVGGDDCDDGNAEVNTAAAETWANGFTDNDCDRDDDAVVLEFGANVWAGWRAGDLQGRRTAALGDLDGDGLADVLVGSEYDATLGDNSGAVYAIRGSPTGSLEVGRALYPDSAGSYFASDVDAGVDATGDGVPDLLVGVVGSTEAAGTAWIVDGAAWVDAGDSAVSAVEDGFVSGSAAGTYGPSSVRFVGDVTGDGVSDIALSECCGTSVGPSSLGRVAIFSVDGFAGSVEDADAIIEGPYDLAYIGGELDPIGDQNGDGLDDLLVSGTNGLAAAVVGGAASGSLADLAISVIYGDVSAAYANARNAGDLDGDGRSDVAILGEDDAGLIYLFTAVGSAPTRALDAPSCVFDWTEGGGVADIVPLGDRDGDGRDELFVPQFYSDSGSQRAWILRGAAVSYGGLVDAETADLRAVSVVPTAQFGYSAALAGDVDGDGADDIVVGAPDYSAAGDRAGAATLITVPR